MVEDRQDIGATWQRLREILGDSFTVRVHGMLGQELRLLDSSGKEAGRLEMNGLAGASFQAGSLESRIEQADQTEGAGYRMLAGDEEILTVRGSLAESMTLSCGGEIYDVRASPLRNTASAGSGRGEAARIEGNVWGRRYQVTLDERDRRALPVVIFLLYQTVSLRSRAYRTSAG